MNRNEQIAEALEAYGEDIRNDWSDFDGRSLQHTLSELAFYLKNPEEPFDLSAWLEINIREEY